MMRLRTSFLFSALKASLISFSRPSNWADELLGRERLDPVGLGIAVVLAGDGQRLRQVQPTSASSAASTSSP